MIHQVDSTTSGMFIKTDTTLLHPLGKSNFTLGDNVLIDYIADQKVLVIDDSVVTENPYSEIWAVTYIDTHAELEIPKHQEVDTANVDNFRYDHDPIDLAIWIAVIAVGIWMIYIIVKVL